ncbi:MAG: MBL fold metallo-hydrolase [Chloroflexi bacterium]|nr:MBL fold metallo-hydrolase [Chloroflexota bacterium]MBI4198476.1 MBL fold metallo-hydrolase [Chloroflexota bacterium]
MPSNTTIGQLEITRYVQSTIKIKVGGKVIWIDPVMINAEHVGNDKADVLLVTHEHGDHFNVDAINACVKQGTTLACPKSGMASKIWGSVKAEVSAMKEGDTHTFADIPVRAVPGYNNFHPRNGIVDSFNVGYIITVGGQRILHTGDTGLINEFKTFGALDVAMVPIGGSGYTMDETEGAKAVNEMLKPKVAIPIHYGFATGGDPNKFKQLIGAHAQVHILDAVFGPMRRG